MQLNEAILTPQMKLMQLEPGTMLLQDTPHCEEVWQMTEGCPVVVQTSHIRYGFVDDALTGIDCLDGSWISLREVRNMGPCLLFDRRISFGGIFRKGFCIGSAVTVSNSHGRWVVSAEFAHAYVDSWVR